MNTNPEKAELVYEACTKAIMAFEGNHFKCRKGKHKGLKKYAQRITLKQNTTNQKAMLLGPSLSATRTVSPHQTE